VLGVPEGLEFDCSAQTLSRAEMWNLVTAAGRLDLAFTPSGTAGYEHLSHARCGSRSTVPNLWRHHWRILFARKRQPTDRKIARTCSWYERCCAMRAPLSEAVPLNLDDSGLNCAGRSPRSVLKGSIEWRVAALRTSTFRQSSNWTLGLWLNRPQKRLRYPGVLI